jgi:iron complex outermembrane receptor protein
MAKRNHLRAFLAGLTWLCCAAALAASSGTAAPQSAEVFGTLRGTVVLERTGDPLHKATVHLSPLGRHTETKEDGTYEFTNLPPGSYEVSVHMTALSDERQTVRIVAGQTATADFRLRLGAVREQVTVTASLREQTAFETFQAVTSVESLALVERARTSLGEVLEKEPGVAKRSFGPGPARPVIRGFDGDRVLVMQDGIGTGTLSSQSGDHGETMSVLDIERLEVVKGPATLLYGSNAIGGVVNAVTRHHQIHEHPHPGLTGYLSALGGTTNGHGGGGAGFEYGAGKWLLWGHGSGQRTGDYGTPLGTVPDSKTRLANGGGGFGYYGERGFFSFGYTHEDSRFGIPFAHELIQHNGNGDPDDEETVELASRRSNIRFTAGARNLNTWLESFRFSYDFTDYKHTELENGAPANLFNNKQFVYRGVFEQKRRGRLSGSFGFWGLVRDYKVTGEEALAPPTNQKNFAVFALEEMDFERFRLQFGGRVENTRYSPRGLGNRSFTGFSGAAGIHIPLWKGGAFVTNYTHSYRAPALEELYNFGPHIGNLTFEIGNAGLRAERSNGLDFSLRHRSGRIRAEGNFFYYRISDFVFLAPTGEIEDGLIEAEFLQGGTRYLGGEAGLDIGLHRYVWLNLGLDLVSAELRASVTSPVTGVTTPAGTPLPRIPPLRGRAGFDIRWNGFSLRPEVVAARSQENLFVTETRTPGYAVFGLQASYTCAQPHAVHVFSMDAFNLSNRLYRNHLSFIKDLAPEIGRGVRFGYTLRFF